MTHLCGPNCDEDEEPGMRRYTEEPGKRTTIGDLGLGGVEYTINFGTAENMQRAAMHLMKCHPHHFVVLPDWGFALGMSKLGTECIMKAIQEGKLKLDKERI